MLVLAMNVPPLIITPDAPLLVLLPRLLAFFPRSSSSEKRTDFLAHSPNSSNITINQPSIAPLKPHITPKYQHTHGFLQNRKSHCPQYTTWHPHDSLDRKST